MALNERVVLDIQSAQRQIDDLERQLAQLSQPINVPVNVSGTGEVEGLRRDFSQADDAVDRLNRELNQTDDALRRVGREADDSTNAMLRVGTRGVSAFSNLRGSILGVAGAFVAFQGARAFLDFAGDSIEAASDLEESTSKAQVVFGSFFDDIEAFASTAPQALGLANAQALEFTGTFGNLFVALGLSQSAAADLAPEIVQLGADLASFNNLEVTEALDKLRAGLVGEAEPLRALGININAATVEAKALELGLADASGAVDDAAKVQARYALILEQTTTAQGDFARTSDGIANRQRTLTAEFQNTRAAVGEALLPAFELLLEIAPQLTSIIETGLVPAIASMSSAMGDVDTEGFARAIAGLPSAVGSVFTRIGSGTQAVGNAVQIFGALARLEFGDVGTQFQQLGDDIQSFREAPVVNQTLQNLFTTMAGGAEPTRALEAVLVELGKSVRNLDLDTFEALAEQIVAIAITSGALPGDLFALADTFEQIGEAAGFSEPGVKILAEALRDPALTALADASVGDIIAGNLAGAGDAAAQAAPPINDLGEALGDTATEATAFETAMQALDTAITVDFSGAIDEFDLLTETVTEAGDTVPATVEQMITDLRTQADRFARLEAATAVLEALGLENLAAELRSQGPDAVTAAEDFVDDIAGAIEAETLLTEGGELGDSALAGFRQALADGNVTPELLQWAADNFTSSQVQTAIYLAGIADGNIFVDGVSAALAAAALQLNIPVQFLEENVNLGPGPFPQVPTPPPPPPPPDRNVTQQGATTEINTTVNINSPSIATTDAQRAAQAINGIIAVT